MNSTIYKYSLKYHPMLNMNLHIHRLEGSCIKNLFLDILGWTNQIFSYTNIVIYYLVACIKNRSYIWLVPTLGGNSKLNLFVSLIKHWWLIEAHIIDTNIYISINLHYLAKQCIFYSIRVVCRDYLGAYRDVCRYENWYTMNFIRLKCTQISC